MLRIPSWGEVVRLFLKPTAHTVIVGVDHLLTHVRDIEKRAGKAISDELATITAFEKRIAQSKAVVDARHGVAEEARALAVRIRRAL